MKSWAIGQACSGQNRSPRWATHRLVCEPAICPHKFLTRAGYGPTVGRVLLSRGQEEKLPIDPYGPPVGLLITQNEPYYPAIMRTACHMGPDLTNDRKYR